MSTLLIIAAIAGTALLWRVFRYDDENPLNKVIDRFPYILRKPLTCGMCFTFWVSLLANILFVPFGGIDAPVQFRVALAPAFSDALSFLGSWFALGACSAFVVYLIDTLYQVSHYFKHAAHHR